MTGKPAAAALALACGVLALAAFVTTTSEGALWSWSSGDRSGEESPTGETCEGGDCRDDVVGRDLDGTPALEVPRWLETVSTVLLWLLVGALVMIIVRRLQLRRREKLLKGKVEATRAQPPEEAPYAEAEELADELEQELAALAGGSPRNAIVAAWIALETAAERAGIHQLETETPTEFTRRALARYRLDPDALQRLADLYREARFSRHRLTDHHLGQARDCLTLLTDQLRNGARATGSAT